MAENITNWHLVLFAEGSYDLRAAGRRLKRQAKESGLFSTITLDNKRTLVKNHSDFYFTFKEFISKNPRGYGKWIWKPYLILSKLNEIPSGDGVIYLDSGCYFNLKTENARLRFTDYLTMAKKHGSLAMQLYDFEFSSPDLTDSRHSKPFLLDFPPIKEDHYQTNQVQAGIVFLINNSQNLEFLTQWHKLTIYYNQLLSDKSYLVKNSIFVEDFNWDQSIFSLLYKQSEFFCLKDETYFSPNWFEGERFPIWAMRWKRGSDPFRFDYHNLYEIPISFVDSKRIRLLASCRYRLDLLLKQSHFVSKIKRFTQ